MQQVRIIRSYVSPGACNDWQVDQALNEGYEVSSSRVIETPTGGYYDGNNTYIQNPPVVEVVFVMVKPSEPVREMWLDGPNRSVKVVTGPGEPPAGHHLGPM